jgi:hypothetical protein
VEARDTKWVVWGSLLVGLGVVYLLERMGLIATRAWWPFILMAFATTRLVDGRIGSAMVWLLLSGWFLAVSWDWNGMTYGNSWPLVLVAVGAGIVIKAITGEERRCCARPGGPVAGDPL